VRVCQVQAPSLIKIDSGTFHLVHDFSILAAVTLIAPKVLSLKMVILIIFRFARFPSLIDVA
jgi:hypothetical protein